MSTVRDIKQQVHNLADHLADGATWDDVRYQVELRRSIERGISDSDAGRTQKHEEVLKEFGIAE
ncbi:MAG TPA: hypothetical protein VNF48_07925 [Gammaproteobacteria bacterium]|nr:hypothetical protein [Gammaproteobacteria bacterium]